MSKYHLEVWKESDRWAKNPEDEVLWVAMIKYRYSTYFGYGKTRQEAVSDVKKVYEACR